jgi:hypothetical protein
MLPAMKLWGLSWLWLAGGVSIAVACGGAVETTHEGAGGDAGGGAGGSGGVGATGGSGGSGATGASGGTGGSGGSGGSPVDSGADAEPDNYVDPGCPDAEPPPVMRECEPFQTPTGCFSGEGCYPFVQYPTEPCGQEQYGTYCAWAGSATQGEPCGGATQCAANHVCVITGQGTQCVQLCPLVGDDGCPPGLFCVPVDVEGIGGCF